MQPAGEQTQRRTRQTILLAYRDGAHERLGKSYCEKLSNMAGEEQIFAITEWKFEMLAIPTLQALAEEEAKRARILVLATQAGEALSPEMKSWLSNWCGQRRRSPGALVILLSSRGDVPDGLLPDYSFLDTETKKSGVRLVVYASEVVPQAGMNFTFGGAKRVTGNGLESVADFPETAAFEAQLLPPRPG